MNLPLFNLDLLRTLTLAHDQGSFRDAARSVGRTQSAVRLQMRRLEDLAGVELFEKTGRNAQLTEGGLVLLDYARQLLALNDEAVQAVSGLKVRGKIRLGMLQDFAETIRPSALASFSRAHPAVELEVRVERSTELLNALQRRDLIWSSCSGPRIRAKRSLPNRLEKYQWSGSGNIHPNRTKS